MGKKSMKKYYTRIRGTDEFWYKDPYFSVSHRAAGPSMIIHYAETIMGLPLKRFYFWNGIQYTKEEHDKILRSNHSPRGALV